MLLFHIDIEVLHQERKALSAVGTPPIDWFYKEKLKRGAC